MSLNPRGSQPRHRAFTLVEIMIVVTIIGILLTLGLTNFWKAAEKTRTRTCQNNLRKMQWAKESYMMERGFGASEPEATFTDAALYGQDRYIKDKPTCPGGGTYSIGDGLSVPTCDYQGGNVHTFESEDG
jgi:general secretion pathway protein G